ncbi:hypothetical protein M0Q97_05210 [Candidatus Dojkabacteria bacterium]|jgi:hypothetical protein|nr:hypothetical protein [Candidatus Dojkabacteria bacterium]
MMDTLNKILDLTNRMVSNTNSEAEAEAYVSELSALRFDLNYEKMSEEHFILDSDTIIKTLNFFVSKNDTEKCKFLANILNTYYLDTFISNEEYEKCALIKKNL